MNLGLASTMAMEEARRCLNCGVCNDCELCLILCPDVAIARVPGNGGFCGSTSRRIPSQSSTTRSHRLTMKNSP